jgi:LmbE family N-acetylglucosaminyl deacetylase
MKRILFGSKKVRWWVRIVRTFGLTVVILGVFYKWQPYVYDFISRNPPHSPKMAFASFDILKKDSRVLVVTAHPDDDAFYIGGTLLRLKKSGATIQNVVLTNGDKGFEFFVNSDKVSKLRQAEQRASSSFYGAQNPIFLGERDGRTKMSDRLVERMKVEIRRFKPTAIICFDNEFPRRWSHRDHRNSGRAAVEAAKELGFKSWILMFETLAPNTACDIESVWLDKMALFSRYPRQYTPKKMPMVQGAAANYAYQTGIQFGMTFGEPFRAIRF